MKVLVVTIVCIVAITTTHGFGIGLPPFGIHPLGLGMPPFALGMPPFGLGIPPLGLGIPHLGLGIPTVGLGIPTAGLGVSSLGVGNTGSVKQGSVHTGTQGVSVIGYHGHDNDHLDAYAVASYAAAPTTIAATAVAPAGHAAYEPVYIAV
ncbi:uncharacterized protein [Haliotis asinina]|uniref:uncharacterized protein n=1 Tax=Haliotis asinina TaxID=109174 RepID=UPI0035322D79